MRSASATAHTKNTKKEIGRRIEELIRKGKMGEVADYIEEVVRELERNKYMERIREIVEESERLKKEEILKEVERVLREIKEIEYVVNGLKRIVENSDSMSKEEIVESLRSLAKSVGSDRLGRRLMRIIDEDRKRILTKEEILKRIKEILPVENNILIVLSRFEKLIREKDVEGIRKLSSILSQILQELKRVRRKVKEERLKDGDEKVKKIKIVKEILDTRKKIEGILEKDRKRTKRRIPVAIPQRSKVA